jgi:hypothetical protein
MGFSSGTSFSTLGNVQLRFGLFNTSNVGTSTGWLGYMAELPNANAGVIQADTATTGNWAAGAGGTGLTVTNGTAGTTTAAGSTLAPYNFSLTITETAPNTQSVQASFISNDGTSFIWNGSATDSWTGTAAANSTVASENSTYNAIGIFDGTTGMGSSPEVDLSNVMVTTATTPEPASLGLLGVVAAGMLLRKRRNA